ncbi:GNAT family N-acetyltransferase [Candidatus Sumerlaeota bacterium]|nr:GNAT family N-acetyltransferase [Candidatus Sumerlaeota bacterium]
MADVSLHTLTDSDQVEARLAGLWDRLLPSRPHRNLFMSFDLIRLWCSHTDDCSGHHVMVFEEGGEIIGFLPLSCHMRQKGPISYRTLELMGSRSAELSSLPLPPDRPDLIRLALAHLLGEFREWDVLWLAEIDAEDPVGQSLEAEARERGLAVDTRCSALCPHLPLDRPFDALIRGLFDGKGRNARRRKVKALENEEGVEFHRWESGENLDALLQRFAALERLSWKGQEGIGLFAPECTGWHGTLIRHMVERGLCEMRWITQSDELISYRIGFIWDQVYYDFNTAYHPDVARLSPSGVILLQLVEHLANSGVKKIDFCRGVQRYKLEWATGLRENRLIRVFNRTARARALSGAASLKSRLTGKSRDERPELPIPLKRALPPYEG